MPRRSPSHEHDAGGDAAVLAAKSALRREVWGALRATRSARFPGAEGRIPNFVGAERAAERLCTTREWQHASTLKANPDAPQLPVRERALEDGKRLYMAVPRLASAKPFMVLDPSALTVTAHRAASIAGAAKQGRSISLEEVTTVDLVVAGCVAVSSDGARLGKGGGYSDLEFALGWEAGLVGPSTVVVTTVHDQQVVPDGNIPMTDHDFRLDLIATPSRIIRCTRPPGESKPGILWDDLTDEKVASIPVLKRLRGQGRKASDA